MSPNIRNYQQKNDTTEIKSVLNQAKVWFMTSKGKINFSRDLKQGMAKQDAIYIY